VRITSFQGTEKKDIGPGQKLIFTSGKLGFAMPAAIHADSWLHGSLVVVDMPLSQLLAELSRSAGHNSACPAFSANA